jgi:lipoyl-dependent peroxiredoxin
MKIIKTANVEWVGDLKQGKGKITTQSGALKDQPYGFNTRFEDKPGTNPEELIAAAHSSCFTMALSKILTEKGFKINQLNTKSEITLEKINDSFSISLAHLDLAAQIPEIDKATFDELTSKAKENCPISKLLNTKITLKAVLI